MIVVPTEEERRVLTAYETANGELGIAFGEYSSKPNMTRIDLMNKCEAILKKLIGQNVGEAVNKKVASELIEVIRNAQALNKEIDFGLIVNDELRENDKKRFLDAQTRLIDEIVAKSKEHTAAASSADPAHLAGAVASAASSSARAAASAAPAASAISVAAGPAKSYEEAERRKMRERAGLIMGNNDYKPGNLSELITEAGKKLDTHRKADGELTSEGLHWKELLDKLSSLDKITQDPDADLDKHPDSLTLIPKSQLTIGDTHGNAIKLIYFLIRQGVLKLSGTDEEQKAQYKELVNIYNTNVNALTKEQLDRFDKIVEIASVDNRAFVRFIGDELGDRGANDYFTLKIFERLNKEKVPWEALYSDHGAEFVKFFDAGCPPGAYSKSLTGGLSESLTNLGILVKKGLVDQEKLKAQIKEHYIPHVKLISYTIDESSNNITLYSHAPVGLETLKALADKFGVVYKDESTKELAATMDRINEKFNALVADNKISDMYREESKKYQKEVYDKFCVEYKKDTGKEAGGSDSDGAWDNYWMRNQPSKADFRYPLLRVIWSRYPSAGARGDERHELEKQGAKPRGYRMNCVHGHTNYGWVPENCRDYVVNLDANLGKDHLGAREEITGTYKIHSNLQLSAEEHNKRLEEHQTLTAGSLPVDEFRSATLSASAGTTAMEAAASSAAAASAASATSRAATGPASRSATPAATGPTSRPAASPASSVPPQQQPPASSDEGPLFTSGSSLNARLTTTETQFSAQAAQLNKADQPKIMSAAYKAVKRTSQPLVVATADITPEKLQSSLARIQDNIRKAQGSTEMGENSIYKGANIEQANPNNLIVKVNHEDGRLDEITRTVGSDNKMKATLSRNSDDASFLLFCDMNKEFSPLVLKPCGDVDIALKVLEAGIMRGVKIEISDADKQKFDSLPESDPNKIHYKLLHEKPNEFLDKISTLEQRKLGQTLPPDSNVLSFTH